MLDEEGAFSGMKHSCLRKKIFALSIMLFLTGCIQQDIHIVLHPDGSGEYRIRRVTSQLESAIIANLPAQSREKFLAEQQSIEKEYHGAIKAASYNINASPDDPSKFIESKVYTFSNLGEALPALESLVEMGPRYTYHNGRFIIFRNREKEEWDGFINKNEDIVKDAYFNLTIELPVEPLSSNGVINGTTVSWNFNADDLKRYEQMQMGDNLIEASIPASSIKVDLKPRLVVEKKWREERKELSEPIEYFTARFPILENSPEGVKASLQIIFPIEGFNLPIFYKDLEIESMIVEGEAVKGELKSELSGVFDGKNQWGADVEGFPVSLEFPLKNPWIDKIDLLRIKMKINEVEKAEENTVEVPLRELPAGVSFQGMSAFLDKIAISKINLGSTTSMWPLPSITLLTTAQPSIISAFFLDTDYGLRYKAESMKTTPKKLSDFRDKKIKVFVNEFFGAKDIIYEYKIGFAKMPKPPFKLIIRTIEEQNYQPKTFTLENIDVSF